MQGMGVGTGPAGPAAAGPIFSKRKNIIYSLANMGMGTGDDDPPFRLTCYDNVYKRHLCASSKREMDSTRSTLYFFCVCHLSRRFPFQNVRLDRRVKHARLEQSGVKSTAAMPVLMHAAFCYLCMMTKVEKKFKASTKREPLTFILKV